MNTNNKEIMFWKTTKEIDLTNPSLTMTKKNILIPDTKFEFEIYFKQLSNGKRKFDSYLYINKIDTKTNRRTRYDVSSLNDTIEYTPQELVNEFLDSVNSRLEEINELYKFKKNKSTELWETTEKLNLTSGSLTIAKENTEIPDREFRFEIYFKELDNGKRKFDSYLYIKEMDTETNKEISSDVSSLNDTIEYTPQELVNEFLDSVNSQLKEINEQYELTNLKEEQSTSMKMS